MIKQMLLISALFLFTINAGAQSDSQINIFLPEFFKMHLDKPTAKDQWIVMCYDNKGNSLSGDHADFLDLVALCDCYERSSKTDEAELKFTYRRLSPVMWERADHLDYGRVQLYFDLPSNVIATDTIYNGYRTESKKLVVKHYYQLRRCQ